MAETTPLEDATIELTSTLEERERAAPDPDERFRILVLGDFSGRQSRGIRDPSDLGRSRTPVRVDRDNIEELPGELGTEASVPLVEDGVPIRVAIRTLEDFHPDRLFTETAAFSGLRKTRMALESGAPEEFEEASSTVQGWSQLGAPTGPVPQAPPAAPAPPSALPPTDAEKLVRELLERSSKRGTSEDLDRFVRQVVAPHLAPRVPSDREGLLGRVDFTVGAWMRDLLHEPGLQELEAAWRSLEFLVRRVDEDSTEVHVLDVTRAELAEDLRRSDLSQSGLHRVLIGDAAESFGGKPWSAIVGMWTISPTVEDVALLGRMARLAHASGAPFLAGAAPSLAGPQSGGGSGPGEEAEEALWQALRGMPSAEWIGLALPRFLLRLPYGAATDPAEEFSFEEAETGGREELLWANPAIACALLLSQAFEQDGWNMTPGSVRDIDGLPLYVHKPDAGAEARLTPCAEALLSDAQAEALLERGLMPVVTKRGSDAIRFVRFQSIRDPLTPLAGPWSETED